MVMDGSFELFLQSCCKKLDILYIEMAGSYWYPVAC